MLNLETHRQRDGWMLFPEHHESCLAVPVGREATLGTPEGSSFRFMHMPAFRAGATGTSFPNEARCDTRLFGLVSEVLLDPAGFHLGNLLARFPAEPLLLFGVLFDTSRVADHQFADTIVDTPVDRLSGGLVKKVSDLSISLAFDAPLGTDKFLPAAASLGATGKSTAEPAKGLVALPLDGTDLSAGNHQAGTVFSNYGNRMDLADVDTGTNAGDRLGIRVFTGIAEDVTAFSPEDVTGVDLFRDDQAGIDPVTCRQGEDQGTIGRPLDRHLFEWNGDEPLLSPRIPGVKSLTPVLGSGKAVGAETVSQRLDSLAVQTVAPLEGLLQVAFGNPAVAGIVVGLGHGENVVPATSRFLLNGPQPKPIGIGQAQYAVPGLYHLILLHCDSMYWRMTSVETDPMVAQKYDLDQMEPFFFSSGNRAARVEPEPPLIFPASSAGEKRGGADRDRWIWSGMISRAIKTQPSSATRARITSRAASTTSGRSRIDRWCLGHQMKWYASRNLACRVDS